MTKSKFRDEETDQKVHENGESPLYEGWSKEELSAQAREIGLRGRTLMTKAQLVKALRSR
jgi:hypothetical protein